MTKEELFKRNFPDYCRGDECLSPYFDMFEAGIEIATKEMDVNYTPPFKVVSSCFRFNGSICITN